MSQYEYSVVETRSEGRWPICRLKNKVLQVSLKNVIIYMKKELIDIRKADKKFQDNIFNVISIYAPTHKTAIHIYNKVIEILEKAELKLDGGKTKFDFDVVENDIYKNIILFFDDKYQFKREWRAKRTTMGIMVYVRKYYHADESYHKNLTEDDYEYGEDGLTVRPIGEFLRYCEKKYGDIKVTFKGPRDLRFKADYMLVKNSGGRHIEVILTEL